MMTELHEVAAHRVEPSDIQFHLRIYLIELR